MAILLYMYYSFYLNLIITLYIYIKQVYAGEEDNSLILSMLSGPCGMLSSREVGSTGNILYFWFFFKNEQAQNIKISYTVLSERKSFLYLQVTHNKAYSFFLVLSQE